MIKHKIIDNFLKDHEFEILKQNFVDSRMCPWFYFDKETLPDYTGPEIDSPKFTHGLFTGTIWANSGSNYIENVLRRLDVVYLYRAKVNLIPPTTVKNKNRYHIDNKNFVENGLRYSIGILFLNNNNGETILEDGTAIPTIENRMLIIPGNCLHTGTTATDDRRVFLNLNFFNSETNSLYE
jgi:hypothetical protein